MTRLAGIVGHPVAHSLSPAFQGAAFAACGLDVRYELWDTEAKALGGRLASLRDPEYLGANVTIPHKEAVIALLDELGGQSARVGAANTIVNRSGRLVGFNTDGPGFVAALRNEAGFEPAGTSILLVGAGGAARGIAFALADAGAARIAISNRTPERASRLAEDVSDVGATLVRAVPANGRLEEYDCIVNCTSVGMHGGQAEAAVPCDLSTARASALAVDIVYVPEETAFLTAAKGRGMPTLGGLPMLIHQGALAFELWTGVSAPTDVMFAAARSAMAARDSR